MVVVKTDIETRPRLAGNQVDSLVADVDRSELQMRRSELRGALVKRLGLKSRDQRHQSADWIVGTLRIGDMALCPGDDQVPVERATATNLDRIAQRLLIAWLSQDAVVESFAAFDCPFQELRRAIDRDAFLVARDQ